MTVTEIHIPAGKIFWGNILLIVCSLFYLAWWRAAFKPHSTAGIGKTGLLFALTALAGIAGLVLAIKGIGAISHDGLLLPLPVILGGGAVVYFLLLAATAVLMKRQVTTELLLIVGWAVLELAAVDVLCGTGYLSAGAAIVSCIAVGAAALLSMVCYLQYYRLEENAAYLSGTVPLILAALVMAGISVRLAWPR